MNDLTLDMIRQSIAQYNSPDQSVQDHIHVINKKWIAFPQHIVFCIQLLENPQNEHEIFYSALAIRQIFSNYMILMSPQAVETVFNMLIMHINSEQISLTTFNKIIDALAILCIGHTELIERVNFTPDKLIQLYISIADYFKDNNESNDFFLDSFLQILSVADPSYGWCELTARFIDSGIEEVPGNFIEKVSIAAQSIDNLKPLGNIEFNFYDYMPEVCVQYANILIQAINAQLELGNINENNFSFFTVILNNIIDQDDSKIYIDNPDLTIFIFTSIFNLFDRFLEAPVGNEMIHMINLIGDVFVNINNYNEVSDENPELTPREPNPSIMQLMPTFVNFILRFVESPSFDGADDLNRFTQAIDNISENAEFHNCWREQITQITPGTLFVVSALNDLIRGDFAKSLLGPTLENQPLFYGARFIVESYYWFPEQAEQCIQYVLYVFMQSADTICAEYVERLTLLAIDVFANNLQLIDEFVQLGQDCTHTLVSYLYFIIMIPMYKITSQETVNNYFEAASSIVLKKYMSSLEKKKVRKAFNIVYDFINHFASSESRNEFGLLAEKYFEQKGIILAKLKEFLGTFVSTTLNSMLEQLGDALYSDDLEIQASVAQIIKYGYDAKIIGIEYIAEWSTNAFQVLPSEVVFDLFLHGSIGVNIETIPIYKALVMPPLSPEFFAPFIQYVPQLQSQEALSTAVKLVHQLVGEIASWNVLSLIEPNFFVELLNKPFDYYLVLLMDLIEHIYDPKLVNENGAGQWAEVILSAMVEHVIKDYSGSVLEYAVRKMLFFVRQGYMTVDKIREIILMNEADETLIRDFDNLLNWTLSNDLSQTLNTKPTESLAIFAAAIIIRNRGRN